MSLLSQKRTKMKLEIERISLGQFYICYGKYLLLSERDRAAVMAVIELYLQTKDV